jgi:hypothetical protein
VGNATLGDKTIGQAEGAMPSRISAVSLRPVRKKTNPFIGLDLEIRLQDRCHHQNPHFSQDFNDVFSYLIVEFLTETPGVRPQP